MATEDTPPEGGDSNRPMWSMLNEELRREIEDEGEMVEPGRLIVRRLVAKALNCDMSAIKEIFDRMDGKSVPGIAPAEEPRKVIFSWKNYQYPWTTNPDDSSSPSTPDGSASPAS
jgi:hypothetical protein